MDREKLVEELARAFWEHRETGMPARVRVGWDASHELGMGVKHVQREFCRDSVRAILSRLDQLGMVVVPRELPNNSDGMLYGLSELEKTESAE